jgi:hypothetical protein
MTPELRTYIDTWKAIESNRPSNEDAFITLFIAYLKSLDDSADIEFEGEGSYFGRQIKVRKDSAYINRDPGFEISYCATIISVYRSDHEGYWVPEYLKLNQGDARFNEVKTALVETMMTLFGLKEML